MAGQSDQQKAMQGLYERAGQMASDIEKQNFDVQNLFADYQPKFSAGEQLKYNSNYFNKAKDNANVSFAKEAGIAGSGAGARAAASGLTGTLAESMINKSKNSVLDKKFSFLNDLDMAKIKSQLGIMDNANSFDFAKTQASQNVLKQNAANKLGKYNAMAGLLNQQGQFAGGLDDSTWLDDVLTFQQAGAAAALAAL